MNAETERKRVFVLAASRNSRISGSYPELKIKFLELDKSLGERDLPRRADAFIAPVKFLPHRGTSLVKQWAGVLGAKYIECYGTSQLEQLLEQMRSPEFWAQKNEQDIQSAERE